MNTYELKYSVDDDKTEATSKPIWFIVKTNGQRLVKKEQFPYEIMSRVIGPFKSRASAEWHRQSRIYEYGHDSVVFCHSAYYSDLVRVSDEY